MRRRLVLAIAGVAALAVVLFAVPLGLVLARSYDERELLRLQRDTVAATRSIDVGESPGDQPEIPPSDDALGVYDLGGRRVTGAGPGRGGTLVDRVLRTGQPIVARRGDDLVAAVPLVSHERVSGVLLAARRADRADAATRRSWWLIAAIAVVLIAGAVVAAVTLGRRLASPLERLAAAASRLGEGDFSTRGLRSSIPEADRIGLALDATAERLDELVSRERAFSVDASHQLRTPLAALRLELEAMELRGDDSPELRAALAEIDRLQATVETLLAVARDAPREKDPLDLVELLDAVAAAHRGALALEARPLNVAIESDGALARASAPVAREILEVLVGNAIEHGTGAVTLTLRRSDAFLLVQIADEGRGPAAGRDAFARRQGRGRGIGLSLARALAYAEGGGLDWTGGSTFTLSLPAWPAADPVDVGIGQHR